MTKKFADLSTKKAAARIRGEPGDTEFTHATYKKWRSVSSAACCLARGNDLVPDLTLETTPLKKTLKKKIEEMKGEGWGDDKICMHVLFDDTPEAAGGYYEKLTLKHLDSKCATKRHRQAKYRTHPQWKGKHKWAPLYFRKHLVVAYNGHDGIIVFNPATRNFCDSADDKANEPRRKFYENTWKSLAKRAFGGSGVEVTVRHMNVQGSNDCGVWIYLIPHLLRDQNKQTATINDPNRAYANYIAGM